MDTERDQQIIKYCFRVAGVLIIFVGLILTTMGVFQLIATGTASSGLPKEFASLGIGNSMTRMLWWGIAGKASIIVWGIVLCLGSENFAWQVASRFETQAGKQAPVKSEG